MISIFYIKIFIYSKLMFEKNMNRELEFFLREIDIEKLKIC